MLETRVVGEPFPRPDNRAVNVTHFPEVDFVAISVAQPPDHQTGDIRLYRTWQLQELGDGNLQLGIDRLMIQYAKATTDQVNGEAPFMPVPLIEG
jgi:hypothetical protein